MVLIIRHFKKELLNVRNIWPFVYRHLGFPGSSAGKESTCNAGKTCSISGSRRSPGEGIGYPPQYSWASLMAQLVKNLPAMLETWVQSLAWEESPGEGNSYPLQYSGLEDSISLKVLLYLNELYSNIRILVFDLYQMVTLT